MDPYLPMLVSLESPPMKILLHEEHKIQRIPFPRRKKRPNGGVRGGERTHAGLAPSNSFVLLAMAGEIGAGLGFWGFACGTVPSTTEEGRRVRAIYLAWVIWKP